VQCTFHGNTAPWGSNISSDCGGHVDMVGSIVTGGIDAEGIYVDGNSSANISCSDIFGNEGGDWIGPIAGQLGVDGNISADPLYCNPVAGDFTLAENSPCVVGLDPGCEPMGAHPVGCAFPVGVPPATMPRGSVVLAPNYPNPFNPTTTLRYSVPGAGPARLSIFGTDGRLVTHLVDGHVSAGEHDVLWRGVNFRGQPVPSGVYLSVLEAAGERRSRRLVLLR
jgi:hypothetical protein